MEQSQIIRIPKKYGELFSTLSNEELGKLIKELFGYDCKIDGISRVYRDMIIVDIENMESSAMNGKKGGRPKSEKPQVKTPGYGIKKPQVMKNDNLKEDKIKEEEDKEVKINEKENIENAIYNFMGSENYGKGKILEIFIRYFFLLGWKPAKKETYTTMKDWYDEVVPINMFKDDKYEKEMLLNFYSYWNERKLQEDMENKNWKQTFAKTWKYSLQK